MRWFNEGQIIMLDTKILIAIALLILVAAIFIILDKLKNARLNILVAPIDATVKINGKEYSPGSHRLFPGKVTVEITKDGFEERSVELELTSNHTETLYTYLIHKKDGLSYYETSPSDYEALTLMATMLGGDLKEFVNKTEAKIAFRELLPLRSTENNTGRVYGDNGTRVETIIGDATDREECKRVVCLYMLTNSGNDQAARNLLKKYGFEYEDFYIIKDSYDN